MDAKKIGKMIKVLRTKIGYTQHDLADCLSVTDKAVSKWERGLSVPDISIITQLSLLLNTDVDNLLEGNITYLEKRWQGLLVLKENDAEIFSGTMLYGKPLVYILLCYFMLVGIKDIVIDCPERDQVFIKDKLGDGHGIGVHIHFKGEIQEKSFLNCNTMIVYDNPFVYGPNLTKYFQRAMSRNNGVTTMSVKRITGIADHRVKFDNKKLVKASNDGEFYRIPIMFYPSKYTTYFEKENSIQSLMKDGLLYSEPMGYGMIDGEIGDIDSVNEFSNFIRFIQKNSGNQVYCIEEVAKNRGLI